MQNWHKKESIRIAKQMIRAFFIEKNVDEVLRHVNPNGFTWIGSGENEILNNIDDVRKHFKERINKVTLLYRIVGEEYLIGGSSLDSCLVIAKIKFQGVNDRRSYRSALHFSFYFQLIDDALMVSQWHVNIPIKQSLPEDGGHFMIHEQLAEPGESIMMDAQYRQGLLNNFFDVDNIAMKSFRYEEGFPYFYVNRAFLRLFGYSEPSKFMSPDKFSSLAHVHPEDQQRYMDHLAEHFPETLLLNPDREWQWHGSYQIIYRTQAFNQKEKFVLEWGNFLTLNGDPLVSAFVLPLELVASTVWLAQCFCPPPRKKARSKKKLACIGSDGHSFAFERLRNTHRKQHDHLAEVSKADGQREARRSHADRVQAAAAALGEHQPTRRLRKSLHQPLARFGFKRDELHFENAHEQFATKVEGSLRQSDHFGSRQRQGLLHVDPRVLIKKFFPDRNDHDRNDLEREKARAFADGESFYVEKIFTAKKFRCGILV